MNNKLCLPVNYQFIFKQKRQKKTIGTNAKAALYNDDEVPVLSFYKPICLIA